MILRVRDKNGNVQEVLALKGDAYVLTEADKAEIINAVLSSMPSVADILAELPNGDGVSY